MRKTIITALVLVTFIALVLLAAGKVATAPANEPIGAAPDDLPVTAVEFSDSRVRVVSGWAITGAEEKAAVLLVHGIRSNRRSMLGRARLLFENGYSVLMIDLQAHGESAGERLTFGYREADSVSAATSYARNLWPGKKLAIIGTSLGGASAIFAANRHRADAYVLEAVYSSLRDATENRLRIRLGPAGAALAPLLLWQTSLQLGFHADELSAVDRIGDLKAPLLVIAGEKDDRTTLANSKALFSRAAEPKRLWVVPDARHQDFHRFNEAEYGKRVLSFLELRLKQSAK
ncbi:alpha/beta fold hydrolase [Anderseniella sp. Alg231-50]|uniref:alpha/beta fold hydrolase n=1 Tax=Anderseniella sp. Alg231-50 TaxID=1922226 RepID=UPI000D55D84C